MHEFQNKWFLTRQHLALFHFLLFEKCIRILWKCKTLKRESICFCEKPDAWISKQVVSNQATFGIFPFSIVWEMHQNSVEMQNLKERSWYIPRGHILSVENKNKWCIRNMYVTRLTHWFLNSFGLPKMFNILHTSKHHNYFSRKNHAIDTCLLQIIDQKGPKVAHFLPCQKQGRLVR